MVPYSFVEQTCLPSRPDCQTGTTGLSTGTTMRDLLHGRTTEPKGRPCCSGKHCRNWDARRSWTRAMHSDKLDQSSLQSWCRECSSFPESVFWWFEATAFDCCDANTFRDKRFAAANECWAAQNRVLCKSARIWASFSLGPILFLLNILSQLLGHHPWWACPCTLSLITNTISSPYE